LPYFRGREYTNLRFRVFRLDRALNSRGGLTTTGMSG
jgi:hypothetical protein